MEIRGLGIINITQLYGVGSIRERKEVQIVAKLEEWDANKVYDRLGTEALTMEILGVQVPKLEIPGQAGTKRADHPRDRRDERATQEHGYFSAKEFNQNVLKWIETDSARAPYYSVDDSY